MPSWIAALEVLDAGLVLGLGEASGPTVSWTSPGDGSRVDVVGVVLRLHADLGAVACDVNGCPSAWSCHAPDSRHDRRYSRRQVGDTAEDAAQPDERQPQLPGRIAGLSVGDEVGGPAAASPVRQLDAAVR